MTKIMLVEDDNNLREIYGARLQAEGYEIVSAKDGEEALALAVKEKPDLIISDVMMPKISGFDMLDILRQTPETKNTKVVMMTALSQKEDEERGQKLGADRYLVKSQVTLEDVVRVVGEVLSGEPAPVTNPYSAPQDPVDEPATEEPIVDEPVVTDQPAEEPVAADPVVDDPAPVAVTEPEAETDDSAVDVEVPVAAEVAEEPAAEQDDEVPAIITEPEAEPEPTPIEPEAEEPVITEPAPEVAPVELAPEEAPATEPTQETVEVEVEPTPVAVEVTEETVVEPVPKPEEVPVAVETEETPPPKVPEPIKPAPPKPVKPPVIHRGDSGPIADVAKKPAPAPSPLPEPAEPKPEEAPVEPTPQPEPVEVIPDEPPATEEPAPNPLEAVVAVDEEKGQSIEPEDPPETDDTGPKVAVNKSEERKSKVIEPINDPRDQVNIMDLMEKELAKEAAANISGQTEQAVVMPDVEMDTVAEEQKIVDEQISEFVGADGEYTPPEPVEVAEETVAPEAAVPEAAPAAPESPEVVPDAEASSEPETPPAESTDAPTPTPEAAPETPAAPSAPERTDEEKQKLTDLAL